MAGTRLFANFRGTINLLRDFFHAAPTLSMIWGALVLLRAALPAAFAVALGYLTTRVLEGSDYTSAVLVFAAVFFLMQVTGPVSGDAADLLGLRYASALRCDLLDASLSPVGVSHLESSDHSSEFLAAKNLDAGVTGPRVADAIGQLGSNAAATWSGYIAAATLTIYAPVAGPLAVVCWLFARWAVAYPSIYSNPTLDLERNATKAEQVFEVLTSRPPAREVRLFEMQGSLAASYRRALVWIKSSEIDALRSRRARFYTAGVSIVVVYAAIVAWLAWTAVEGSLAVGAAITAVSALTASTAIINPAASWWLDFVKSRAAAGREVVTALKAQYTDPGTATAELTRHGALGIEFQDVSFAYPDARTILSNLSLSIAAGRSTAIVGLNGAGKTTIAKLLCRLYAPSRGRITANGVDISNLAASSWRRELAVIFQDYIKLHASLRDNVAPLGAPDETITRACQAAGVPIEDLDTPLTTLFDGGRDLSGGEWQRVALARVFCAVYQGARIVILDEPTAHLDIRAEAHVFQRLIEELAGVTVVLISHRFPTVRLADTIIVLDEGRVVEIGAHAELVAAQGRYAAMFNVLDETSGDEEGVSADVLN